MSTLLKRKNVARLALIRDHAMMQFMPAAINMLLSLAVVRLAGAGMWGAIVELLLIQLLAVQLSAWGHKDYLLRAFSRHPMEIKELWKSSFFARLPVLVLLLPLLLLLPYPAFVLLNLGMWVLARYILQSWEHIIFF